MMTGCKSALSPVDEEILSGIALLKDFISAATKLSGKTKGKQADQVIYDIITKISNSNYVFLASASTLLETNLLRAWNEYRDKLEKWLGEFVASYCLDVNVIDDLPSDYRAKIALELEMLLAKDLIENHLNDLPNDVRSLLMDKDKPVIRWLGSSLTIADIVGALYPYVLSLLTSGIISYGAEPMRLISQYSDNLRQLYEKTSEKGKRYGEPYRIYKLMYLPLIAVGLVSEFTVPAILKQGAGGSKYRYAITGMGHNFVNSMVLVLSQSLNRIYYEHVLNNLVGVSHAFRIFVKYYLNNIFSLDEFSVAKGLIDEYLKHVKDQSMSKYLSYGISDALKDISTATLALLSQYYELLGENAENAYEYVKYLPAIVVGKPVDEAIKYAVKRLWIYSQA